MLCRSLILLLVGSVGVVAACGTLREAEAPAVKLFDCTATAFTPIAGSYERAVEIVREVQSGRVDVSSVLDAAQATAAEAATLDAALRACVADAKSDLADAGAQ